MSNFPRTPFVAGLLLLSAATLLTACNDDSSSVDSDTDDGTNVTPIIADTVAPLVISSTPSAGATNVSRTSSITATFNEDILGTTVHDASFTLSSGSSVDGTVTFDGTSNVTALAPFNTLAMLTTYTASLSTDITDLVGNPMSGAFSWSFTTADGAWGTAALLETDDAGHARSPQIAFDAHGNGFAIWGQDDGSSNSSILATRYVAGSGWEAAELIEMDPGHASAPQIAFDGSGNAVAVWFQNTDGAYSIWANRYVAGSGWGPAVALENASTSAYFPAITLNGNGDGFAVWYQTDGTRNNIWANRYDATSGWGTAELIEAVDTGNAFYPKVAVDSNGNALAVWKLYSGSRYDLWFNRYDNGSWGSAALLETDDAGSTSDPELAMAGTGEAVVVWSQYDGSTNNILARHYQPVIGWGSVTLLETDADHAYSPQIALDANGDGLAVWEQNSNIWANRFATGNWGIAQLIESDDTSSASSQQVAFDAGENATAVWQQGGKILANRYVAGSWGTAQLVDNNDMSSASSPQVAFDGTGNAAAVWNQFDGSVYNVWSNRFE